MNPKSLPIPVAINDETVLVTAPILRTAITFVAGLSNIRNLNYNLAKCHALCDLTGTVIFLTATFLCWVQNEYK